MRQELAKLTTKMTNSQLRRHNSLLRKNLRTAINCSSENEAAQERIDEMEERIFTSESMKVMFDDLLTHGRRLFDMSVITVNLDSKFRSHYPSGYHSREKNVYFESEHVSFAEIKKLAGTFGEASEPIIRGPIKSGEQTFFPNGIARKVHSEALLPLIHEGSLIGVIAFGSINSGRFQDGQGPRFLKRLSRALSMKMTFFHASA